LKSLLQQGVDPALIKHVSDYVAGVRKGAKSRLFPERRDSTQALRGLDKGFKQR
jgi:hypothetical protein